MGAPSEFINHYVTTGFFAANWHFLNLEIKSFSFKKSINASRSNSAGGDET